MDYLFTFFVSFIIPALIFAGICLLLYRLRKKRCYNPRKLRFGCLIVWLIGLIFIAEFNVLLMNFPKQR